MTSDYRARSVTPNHPKGVARQAAQHFRQTGPRVKAAYRGWAAIPTKRPGLQQIVCLQVERPNGPIQRMRGYGRATVYGTTTVGVRKNSLVDLTTGASI